MDRGEVWWVALPAPVGLQQSHQLAVAALDREHGSGIEDQGHSDLLRLVFLGPRTIHGAAPRPASGIADLLVGDRTARSLERLEERGQRREPKLRHARAAFPLHALLLLPGVRVG
jgi:hypothetical protein